MTAPPTTAVDPGHPLLADSPLRDVAERLAAGERLTEADAVRCLTTDDLHGLGHMAHRVRTALHGDRAWYNVNLHIDYTNVCAVTCTFCSFRRGLKDDDAYLFDPDALVEEARPAVERGATEVHIVGGLHPKLPFEYYEDALRALKRAWPRLHLKCFTAVEIAWFASIYRMTVEEVLTRLRDAGLDSLPGGGAEIFAERVRAQICRAKADADEWLDIHRTWHRLGGRSNCTMLYGHVETPEERADHLGRLRALQDESNAAGHAGFQTVIPLAYHPENNSLGGEWTTAEDDLRTLATTRLFCDNIPHVKAYWPMYGLDLAAYSLRFGVDDVDGTVEVEQIYHEAGAETPQGADAATIRARIREAGFEPVERDTLYREVERDGPRWWIRGERPSTPAGAAG